MILIFGQIADPHVVAVCRALEEFGKEYRVVDAYDNSPSGLTYEVSQNCRLQLKGREHNVVESSAIWWRVKPRFVVPADSATELFDYNFIRREWLQVFGFLGSETAGVFSINNRASADRADNKMFQLQSAVAAGFEIPRTLISNDPDAIMAFVEGAEDGQYVYKPFTPYMPPSGLITFTSAITVPMLEADRKGVSVAPGIYQAFVKKEFELRITIVGNELFPARINSKHSVKAQVDWRRAIFDDIYTPVEVEEGFREKLLMLHRRFGLFFAAYDFIVDEEGRMIFLEVNPTGQWLWLEDKLGLPISQRIATALANPQSVSSPGNIYQSVG